MTRKQSEGRWRIKPKYACFLPSDVSVGVGPLRTKMETVAFTQAICAPGDIKLNLALKHISELFSFVLNQTFAASARFDMINVSREKMTGGRWNDCLELDAAATAHLIGFDHGALSTSQHDILGVSSKLKEAGYWST